LTEQWNSESSFLKGIGNHDRRPACHGNESDAGASGGLGKEEQFDDIAKFVETLRCNRTSLSHHRIPNRCGNSQRRRVRGDGALTSLVSSAFPNHHRLTRGDLVEQRKETPALTYSFEIHANDARLVIRRQVIEVIAHIEYSRIAKTHCLADFYPVIGRGHAKGHRMRPTLADKTDRARLSRGQFSIVPQTELRVINAHTVGADQRHPRGPSGIGHGLFQAPALLIADLGET